MNAPQKTTFAQKTTDLAETLTDRFKDTLIAGAVPRRPRFLGPEVETTSGGRQARQSIQLVPEGHPAESPLVCGFIDVGAGMAHLRTFASFESLQLSRHGRPLGLEQDAYKAFLDELGRELAEHRILARMTNEMFQPRAIVDAAPPEPSKPAPAGLGTMVAVFAVGVVVGVGIGAVLFGPQGPLRVHPAGTTQPAP